VIAIAEDDAARLRPGQQVRLKARALPFEVFEVKVVRVAPKAVQGDAARSTVNVYCQS
jgi:multidrug resistance efflux pump